MVVHFKWKSDCCLVMARTNHPSRAFGFIPLSLFLIFLVICVVCYWLVVFVLCLMYPMLPVSLDCTFVIDPSLFSKVWLLLKEMNMMVSTLYQTNNCNSGSSLIKQFPHRKCISDMTYWPLGFKKQSFTFRKLRNGDIVFLLNNVYTNPQYRCILPRAFDKSIHTAKTWTRTRTSAAKDNRNSTLERVGDYCLTSLKAIVVILWQEQVSFSMWWWWWCLIFTRLIETAICISTCRTTRTHYPDSEQTTMHT
jgi:hypothetical protein